MDEKGIGIEVSRLKPRAVSLRAVTHIVDIVFIIDAALYLVFDLALIRLTGGVGPSPRFFSASASSVTAIFFSYGVLRILILIGCIVVPLVIILNSFIIARVIAMKTKINTYEITIVLSLALLTGAFFLFYSFLLSYV